MKFLTYLNVSRKAKPFKPKIMNIEKCAIIGYDLKPNELKPLTSATIEYETEFVGKVKITIPAYMELFKGDFERYLIAGICKQRTINGLEPILIDNSFIQEGYKKFAPSSFDEKCMLLNKVLYQLFGKENIEFELMAGKHFALGYANPEEFSRLMDQLITERFLTVKNLKKMSRFDGSEIYIGVKMTSYGKEEAKKALPKMPLFGLVNQEIETGNKKIDEKINHARTLFFSEPQTIDNMRSACETLSFILEPYRDSLKSYFSSKDVSDFFQLVNGFDIRHNKDATKKIEEPEQLEWVFYSLLNTINTFAKLEKKYSK